MYSTRDTFLFLMSDLNLDQEGLYWNILGLTLLRLRHIRRRYIGKAGFGVPSRERKASTEKLIQEE